MDFQHHEKMAHTVTAETIAKAMPPIIETPTAETIAKAMPPIIETPWTPQVQVKVY